MRCMLCWCSMSTKSSADLLFTLFSPGHSFGSRGLLLLGEKDGSNSAQLILARSCSFSKDDNPGLASEWQVDSSSSVL